MWISKVLRQIDKIKPGMRRKDLLKGFTTDGALSNRFQRTYVQKECPYIKVDVRFKAVNNEPDVLNPQFIDLSTIYRRSQVLPTSVSACKFVQHRVGHRVGQRVGVHGSPLPE